MSKQTQKEAVFSAVISVLSEANIQYEQGTDVTPYMTRELRAQVNNILFQGFKSGSIELDKEFDDAKLKAYVSGLQSNWLRKDQRLNGGTAYIAKNPGSRQGAADPQLKAMRALIATLVDANDKAEVQQHIDARIKELSAAKQPAIDVSSLPESLRNYVK